MVKDDREMTDSEKAAGRMSAASCAGCRGSAGSMQQPARSLCRPQRPQRPSLSEHPHFVRHFARIYCRDGAVDG